MDQFLFQLMHQTGVPWAVLHLMALGLHFPPFVSPIVPLFLSSCDYYIDYCQNWSFLTADNLFIEKVLFQTFLLLLDYVISLLIQDQKHPCHFLPGKNGFSCALSSQKPDAVFVIGVFCFHTFCFLSAVISWTNRRSMIWCIEDVM